MSELTLRQLARRYADGALDTEAYRSARAEYIETVLTADGADALTHANYTSPPTVAGEETVTAAQLREYDQTRIISGNDPSPHQHMQTQPIQLSDGSQPSAVVIAAAVAGILILALVIGSTLFSGSENEPADAAAGMQGQKTQPAAMQPMSESSGNTALARLQAFLEAPQWTQQALDDFVSEWQSLPRDDRETALQTTLARQLGDALYRQLLEERALDGLDEAPADNTSGQEKIVNFARDIGLQDRRLEL